MRETLPPRRNFLSRLLWWRIDPADFEDQLRHYAALGLFDSARGRSVLCLGAMALISTLFLVLSGTALEDQFSLAMIAIFVVFAIFVYLGHLWANVATMIFWTMTKMLTLLVPPFLLHLFPAVIWWAFFMSFFYLSYRVEKERRRRRRADLPDNPEDLSETAPT